MKRLQLSLKVQGLWSVNLTFQPGAVKNKMADSQGKTRRQWAIITGQQMLQKPGVAGQPGGKYHRNDLLK
jgi:hypothetical protein